MAGPFEHLLQENRRFPSHKKNQTVFSDLESYNQIYRQSIGPKGDEFWLDQAKTLNWVRFPTVACQYNWDTEKKFISHTWFHDGSLNISVNCIDRHLHSRGKKNAIIWQGDHEDDVRKITYEELHQKTCQFANVLKDCGVKKGDRVCIYLPMIPEAAIAMLACARIGAIHSVVFGGFSSESLAHRLQDSSCKLLITANVALRGGKQIPLKLISDSALDACQTVEKTIVIQRTHNECPMQSGRDFWFHDLAQKVSSSCEAETLMAEDPLFILYTSGSTGKPKGVLHTQAGYLLHTSLSHKYVFDILEEDIYWCTADIGWITGHSYVVYGPLANGSTVMMFEGIPTYPNPARLWQVVNKHKVSILYTAPTVIRSLISAGNEWVEREHLHTLRLLATVGEPINPEAWMWYYDIVGQEKCPVIDTWWQTETGGIMITPIPGFHTLKPGSANRPFFGVEPVVLKDDGSICQPNEGGCLCIKKPWPGIMRTTWGDHERFVNAYFSTFPNVYFTGDGCRIDEEGDYWLLGRVDDVVNVSGHRIGTAEIESALVSHPTVAEAAVVPIPHHIKGQGLHAFVTLKSWNLPTPELKKQLMDHIRSEIGAIAIPEKIQFAKGLPKTRSGKIMRRLLRKIAEKSFHELGDVSTLADPTILEELISEQE